MKVSVIVAVYNEAATVRELLARVFAQPLPGLTKEIVIVESNSTDGSRELVKQFQAEHADDSDTAVRAVYQAQPKGKGNAVREGLATASGDIVIVQDADLEYDAADYPALLQPIVEGRTAFVLGSRHMGPKRWNIRKFKRVGPIALFMNFGGILFHSFFNLTFGTKLTDPTTMYKVFRTDCIRGLHFQCDGFDFDYELLGKLLRSGFTPLEIPVSYRSRGFEEGKKIRILRDPPGWIIAILKSRFGRLTATADAKKNTDVALIKLSTERK